VVEEGGYRDWRGLSQAIKAAAAQAAKEGTNSLDVSAQIVQAHHDRFLSRVFADGADAEWLLKGGTAMLARVPRSRATKDLDLAATSIGDLDDAQQELERVASRDLGDHVRFQLSAVRPTGRGDNQPGVQTRRLVFTCLDAQTGRRIADIPIDLVVGPAPVGRVEVAEPANRLQLPRQLVSHPYRLFPIADQVAEKVTATMSMYAGRPSSRTKDLVDLVTIARTQTVDLRELQLAIESKRALSRLEPFTTLTVPDSWERPYRTLAAGTPSAGGITDLGEALELARTLVDPALAPEPVEEQRTWVPDQGWMEGRPIPDDAPEQPSAGEVHVRPHVRGGRPVTEHWRSARGSGGSSGD
jgi:hypothetical protein